MGRLEINNIRKLMEEHNLDCYIVFTNDYHNSEYIQDYFKERVFLSNFTGSNGNLVITLNEAKLWTDGRYFIQAENELKDTSIDLMKMGEPNVLTLLEYIKQVKPKNIGMDLKLTSYNYYKLIQKTLNNEVNIIDINLVNEIWTNRPKLTFNPIFDLSLEYSGESYLSKLNKVKEHLSKVNAKNHLITKLDDINYLLNLRGNDILYTPYFLGYFLIKDNQEYLYVNNEALNDNVKAYLKENNVNVKNYFDIYEDIKGVTENILLDQGSVNSALINNLNKDVKIIHGANITQKMKAVKNEVEINNTKHAHILDGVAVTRIMKYLKENSNLTELSVQDKLEEYRKELDGFIELSFNTICAYKENAAMMHYSANEKSYKNIDGDGLLLIDSGGQYITGTTDITRTFAIGNISDQLKKDYTLVLKGMINLSKAKFLYGCRGVNLDVLARGPLWDVYLDYKCGTGHGVSHIGNVHEGPNGFRWKIVEERNDSCVLEPGMITTNEPGVYIEGSHGIRIENELLCVELCSNEYGKFLGFETITFAPIDLDCIDKKYLNQEEIDFLNQYHEEVYNKLEKYLSEDEKVFLRKYTEKL